MPDTPQSCGAPGKANEIFDDLIDSQDYVFPEVDLDSDQFKIPDSDGNPLYDKVNTITVADLTERKVEGDGVFDAIMHTMSKHLENEYEQGRITGREYSEVYTAALNSAMGQAVQFLIQKDQAYWSALLVQAQARTAETEAVRARIQLEISKYALIAEKFTALSAAADNAIKKLQLSLMDVDYCIRQKELEQKDKELELAEAQIEIAQKQLELTEADVNIKEYTVTNLLPLQKILAEEQVEVQRAQTMDTRTDGTTLVAGLVGRQKDLLAQQKVSYERDAEAKVGKMFLDSWVTQKTMDEGLVAPTVLQNASIDEVMTKLKVMNNLTT